MEMGDATVDLIVTDPPYEIGDLPPFLVELRRVLKPSGSLYCFGDKRMVARAWYSQVEHLFPSTDLLSWYYKNSPKPKGRWRMSMQLIIYAYGSGSVFNEDDVRVPYNESTKKLHGRKRPSSGRLSACSEYDTSKGALPRDVLEAPALLGHLAKQRHGHPDQKPLDLIKRLILASSNEGDLVLDPFAGTGTTLVAANLLGRHSIGCELQDKWVEVIHKRLENGA